jgi:hypothetical protein
MFRRTLSAAVLGALVLTVGSSAATSAPRLPNQKGGTNAAVIPKLVPGLPIVAGCELPDCYPAPIVPNTVDWQLSVQGPASSEVILRFQPTVAQAVRNNVAKGTARWESATDLHVPVGTLVLPGIPADPGHPAAVEPWVEAPAADRTSAPVSLTVRQVVGTTVVAGYSYRWDWPLPLPTPVSAGDLIMLAGKTDPWPFALMLDGLTGLSACLNDKLITGVDPRVHVTNVVPPTIGCASSEIGVFSRCNGMTLQPPFPRWTALANDHATVKLPSVVEIPAYFWNTRGTSAIESEVDAEIEADVGRANMILTSMDVGIRLRIEDIRSTSRAGAMCDMNDSEWNQFLSGRHESGKLNVYYTTLDGFGGRSCTKQDSSDPRIVNSVLVFPDSNNSGLAHELGHVLSLGAVGQVDGSTASAALGNANIMSSGGTDTEVRNCMTIGQAFRANLNSASAINRLGIRTSGTIRNCKDNASGDKCPALSLDTPRPFAELSYCGAGQPGGIGLAEGAAQLLEWLQCDDCEAPALGRYGPAIIQALEALLGSGPSAKMALQNRIHLELAYTLLVSNSDPCPKQLTKPRLIPLAQYMRLYGPRLAIRVRMRAATALAQIGTPAALDVLKRALTWNLSAEVKAHVALLLKTAPLPPR